MNFNPYLPAFPFPIPPPPLIHQQHGGIPQHQIHQQQPEPDMPIHHQRAQSGENRLPQSLERVLTTIARRAEEVGISPANIDEHILGHRDTRASVATNDVVGPNDAGDDSKTEPVALANGKVARKKLRNRKKKERKKKAKQNKAKVAEEKPAEAESSKDEKDNDDQNVVVEYIQEDLAIDRTDSSYTYFKHVAHHFKLVTNPTDGGKGDKRGSRSSAPAKPRVRDRTQLEEEKEETVADDPSKQKMSKKQLKKLTRLSVAELKQLVLRPDVVEMHDVTARDPKLLVLLKSTRNTVPVPRHWSGKRKYLQGKRGFVKPPFDLPDFIKRTGIMEMRQSLQDKDDHKSLKQKMRERIRPKLGRIEIDYQKLHDAFFKFQTKPRMSIHGDMYYEGKENEIKLKQKKPGQLSDELRAALGMPTGPSADKVPPPWLIAMQRYGPPPSYPNLKIPGLNAPIPEGCSFGYHAGGWGKPPVDEMGRPLYGDVFGCSGGVGGPGGEDIDLHVDRTLWGELESDEEGEEDSDEDSDSGQIVDMTVASQPEGAEIVGAETPSGVASTAPSALGLETPGQIEIRKRLMQEDGSSSVGPDGASSIQPLYHVLAEKPASIGTGLMGTTKVYDVSAVQQQSRKAATSGRAGKSVEIALEPEELEMDSDVLEKRYKEQVQTELQRSSDNEEEDGHGERSGSKRRRKHRSSGSSSSTSKKHKDFKF